MIAEYQVNRCAHGRQLPLEPPEMISAAAGNYIAQDHGKKRLLLIDLFQYVIEHEIGKPTGSEGVVRALAITKERD